MLACKECHNSQPYLRVRQISPSAGIRPLPITKSRISDRSPLLYLCALVSSTCKGRQADIAQGLESAATGLQGARGCSAGVTMHVKFPSEAGPPFLLCLCIDRRPYRPLNLQAVHYGRCPRVRLRAMW